MTTQTDAIPNVERVALHQSMAESYRDAYGRHAVQEGDTESEWTFAPDAVYSSPYFGSEVIELATHPISVRQSATMEALAYSGTFEGWGPVDFASKASDHGFAMKTRFEGRRRSDGAVMGFFAYGCVETNTNGQITSWQTYAGREYDDFLDVAIGLHDPFDGRADDDMEALGRTLAMAGLTVADANQGSGS